MRPTVTTIYTTATRLKSQSASASSGEVPSKDELKPTSKESTRSGTNDQIARDDAAFSRSTDPAVEKSEVGRGEVRSESCSTTTTASSQCYAAAVGAGEGPDTEVPLCRCSCRGSGYDFLPPVLFE